MREATRVQRGALAAVTDAAMVMLGARATDAYRAQIQATLHAASADPSVGEQLRRGRFVRELTGATGFSGFSGLTLVPDLEPPSGPEPAAKTKPNANAKTKPDRAAAERAERAAESERRRIERERALSRGSSATAGGGGAVRAGGPGRARGRRGCCGRDPPRVDELACGLDAWSSGRRTHRWTSAYAGREAARLVPHEALRSRGPKSDGGAQT